MAVVDVRWLRALTGAEATKIRELSALVSEIFYVVRHTMENKKLLISCSQLECHKTAQAGGLCPSHYNQAWRAKQPQCQVNGCDKQSMSKSLCSMHYNHKRNQEMPLCSLRDCDRLSYAKTFCQPHYAEKRKYGEFGVRPPKASFYITHKGYRKITVDGASIFEHRHVMSVHLNRKLLKTENVHHINGDKLDNRIENLELWSTHQPQGQRVDQKVSWAIEILQTYRPELLK